MSNWLKEMTDLDYVNSDVLVKFDPDKHYGLFVYLREDYNGYIRGLYFGGENGWMLLSERVGDIITPTSAVPIPIHNTSPFYYDGTVKTYLPLNWDSISEYCYITGNENTNRGTYEVTVYLKNSTWKWVDGTSEQKTLTYTIEAQSITRGTMRYGLSSDWVYYGEDYPTVEYVDFGSSTLVEGTDYNLLYPTDSNAGSKFITIEFIGNYSGAVGVPFEIRRKPIDRPRFSNAVFSYTGNVIEVFPDNWDDIKSFCTISSNYGTMAGSYTLTVVLNRNYSWLPDESTNPIKFTFEIGNVEVDLPDWSNIQDYYEFGDLTPIQGLYPKNWANIQDRATIKNNIQRDRGDYEIVVSLKGSNLVWKDGTNTDKTKKFSIGSFRVDAPEWNDNHYAYYTGYERVYLPTNWDSISQYCNITDTWHEANVGKYEVKITLKSENYEWKTGGKLPIVGWYEILPAEGVFISGPIIRGVVRVNETLTCDAVYIDGRSQLSYAWYRSALGDRDNLSDAILVQDGISNQYKVQADDVNHYIICVVTARETNNYKGKVGVAMTNTPILRYRLEGVLRWEDNLNEDTIYSIYPSYILPKVIKAQDDDMSWIEYSLVEGGSVADLYNSRSGVLLIKGEGTVIVRATVKDSRIYEYVPDYIDFVLNVYSSDIVRWGLFDKDGNDMVAEEYKKLLPVGFEMPENEILNEKFLLLRGIVPSTAKVAAMKENDKGIHACLFRTDFPFIDFYGKDQLYHGWYLLVPTTRVLYEMDENGGTEMDIEGYKLLDDNGKHMTYTDSEGRTYKGYGCFNVGKTSDNWMLHIITRRA